MEDTRSLNSRALLQQKLSNYYRTPVSVEKQDGVLRSEYAWLALAAIIVAYDAFAIKTKKAETLTKGFWRSMDGRFTGLLSIGAWVALTAHLLVEKKLRQKLVEKQTTSA